MNNEELIYKLNSQILDITEEFKGLIPSYEISHALIANAVSMALYCAPNELAGVKMVMDSVKIGINDYEENHS
jgi:hypothetical protein